jgi:hypothetical protein
MFASMRPASRGEHPYCSAILALMVNGAQRGMFGYSREGRFRITAARSRNSRGTSLKPALKDAD